MKIEKIDPSTLTLLGEGSDKIICRCSGADNRWAAELVVGEEEGERVNAQWRDDPYCVGRVRQARLPGTRV